MQNELINVLEKMAATLEEIREIADANNELKEKVKELEIKVNYLETKMNELLVMPMPIQKDNDDWWKKIITADNTASSDAP